jgi:hypothetical protein
MAQRNAIFVRVLKPYLNLVFTTNSLRTARRYISFKRDAYRSPSHRGEGLRGLGETPWSKVFLTAANAQAHSNTEFHPTPYPLPSRGGERATFFAE